MGRQDSVADNSHGATHLYSHSKWTWFFSYAPALTAWLPTQPLQARKPDFISRLASRRFGLYCPRTKIYVTFFFNKSHQGLKNKSKACNYMVDRSLWKDSKYVEKFAKSLSCTMQLWSERDIKENPSFLLPISLYFQQPLWQLFYSNQHSFPRVYAFKSAAGNIVSTRQSSSITVEHFLIWPAIKEETLFPQHGRLWRNHLCWKVRKDLHASATSNYK